MQQSFKDIAQRIENAHTRFLTCAMELGELTEAQAEKVMRLYSKAKVLKFHPTCGDFSIIHGVYLDKQVLQNTAALNE